MPFGLFVVAYLLLAGAGAGSFFFAACGAVCDALRRTARTERNLEILSGGFLASPFLLCLASICLLFDLGSPQRALLAFCDPFGSVLSFGACCLGLLTVVSIAVAALGIAEKFPVLFMRTGCALGVVLAPLVMGYTGVLLCDLVAVDFWNTPLLAVLFVCSSLSTGYASCMLVHALLRPLAPSAMCLRGVLARVLHIAEGIVLVFFMIGRDARVPRLPGNRSCLCYVAGWPPFSGPGLFCVDFSSPWQRVRFGFGRSRRRSLASSSRRARSSGDLPFGTRSFRRLAIRP